MVDLGEDNYLEAFDIIFRELETFSSELIEKRRIIVGTKLDLEDPDVPVRQRLEELKNKYQGEQVLGISVFSGEGIPELASLFGQLVQEDNER